MSFIGRCTPRPMELNFEQGVTNPTMPMQTFLHMTVTLLCHSSLPVPATGGGCKTFQRVGRRLVASPARKRGIPPARDKLTGCRGPLATLLSPSQSSKLQSSSFKLRLGRSRLQGKMFPQKWSAPRIRALSLTCSAIQKSSRAYFLTSSPSQTWVSLH